MLTAAEMQQGDQCHLEKNLSRTLKNFGRMSPEAVMLICFFYSYLIERAGS